MMKAFSPFVHKVSRETQTARYWRLGIEGVLEALRHP